MSDQDNARKLAAAMKQLDDRTAELIATKGKHRLNQPFPFTQSLILDWAFHVLTVLLTVQSVVGLILIAVGWVAGEEWQKYDSPVMIGIYLFSSAIPILCLLRIEQHTRNQTLESRGQTSLLIELIDRIGAVNRQQPPPSP